MTCELGFQNDNGYPGSIYRSSEELEEIIGIMHARVKADTNFGAPHPWIEIFKPGLPEQDGWPQRGVLLEDWYEPPTSIDCKGQFILEEGIIPYLEETCEGCRYYQPNSRQP
jgi:hypothetical protein